MQLAAFEGRWTLARDIADRCGNMTGRFEGTAVFRPVAEGLAYHEAGVIRLGGLAPLRATRSYLWCGGAEYVEVRFSDGRFFHRFAPGHRAPSAAHDCPPDRYLARYDFAAWPEWRVEWRVSGPRKDYSSVTTYVPAGQGARIAASGSGYL